MASSVSSDALRREMESNMTEEERMVHVRSRGDQ